VRCTPRAWRRPGRGGLPRWALVWGGAPSRRARRLGERTGSGPARVVRDTPFATPWRTIRISPDAAGLVERGVSVALHAYNLNFDVGRVVLTSPSVAYLGEQISLDGNPTPGSDTAFFNFDYTKAHTGVANYGTAPAGRVQGSAKIFCMARAIRVTHGDTEHSTDADVMKFLDR